MPDGKCRLDSTLVHDTEIELKVIAVVRYHPVLSSMSKKTRLIPSVRSATGHQFSFRRWHGNGHGGCQKPCRRGRACKSHGCKSVDIYLLYIYIVVSF